jgi:hypothetical protein
VEDCGSVIVRSVYMTIPLRAIFELESVETTSPVAGHLRAVDATIQARQ